MDGHFTSALLSSIRRLKGSDDRKAVFKQIKVIAYGFQKSIGASRTSKSVAVHGAQ